MLSNRYMAFDDPPDLGKSRRSDRIHTRFYIRQLGYAGLDFEQLEGEAAIYSDARDSIPGAILRYDTDTGGTD